MSSCSLIRTPSGRTMLIDGGSESGNDIGYKLIEPFLRRQGVNRIDVLVLTHPHADHMSGLPAVARDFRVGMVLEPGIPHPSKTYSDFLIAVRERGIPYRKAARGQVLDLGDGTKAQVLNPPAERLVGTEDDINGNSIVLRVTSGRSSIMLMGDAGRDAEAVILESAGSLRCDALKVAHHGSNDSTSDAWLDAVNSQIAVISVGRNNPFGHPSRDVLERLTARGIRVYRTDQDGAVEVSFADGRPSVKTALGR
jgi:competence protein ComEC